MLDQPEESDIRRRAAWLLGMLAAVAVLFVVVLTFLLDSGGDKKGGGNSGAGIDDNASPTTTRTTHSARQSTSTTHSAPATHTSSTHTTASCPSSDTCVLQGDPGDVIAAINSYRQQHGQKTVSAKVSPDAQDCALSNGGSKCSGGWAVGQTNKLDGGMAVKQVAEIPRNGLLDAGVTSFDVGWAFDPGKHAYYIAIIHNT